MKNFVVLTALSLSLSLNLNANSQTPDKQQSEIQQNDSIHAPDKCGCCCRIEAFVEAEPAVEPAVEPAAEPEAVDAERSQNELQKKLLIEVITNSYKSIPGKDRHPDFKSFEEQLLNFEGYSKCGSCNQVVGPGIYHGYRHLPTQSTQVKEVQLNLLK